MPSIPDNGTVSPGISPGAVVTPHLILGGARSGKSRYAEDLVTRHSGPYIYIATAQVLDDEMRERVARHQERRLSAWETVESPLGLVEALGHLRGRGRPVLVDCLTLWLTNLLLRPRQLSPAEPPEQSVDRLCTLLPSLDFPVYLVSNEVGAGIVPENALARQFRDLAGLTNQRVAVACRSVTLVVAGLPLLLKHPATDLLSVS